MNKLPQNQDEQWDEFCRELVQASKADSSEIRAAANAPFLYQRLRSQIQAEQQRRAVAAELTQERRHQWRNWLMAFFVQPKPMFWALGLGATAVLIIGLAGLRNFSAETTSANPPLQVAMQTPVAQPQLQTESATPLPTEAGLTAAATRRAANIVAALPGKRSQQNKRIEQKDSVPMRAMLAETEEMTEFIPLTYVGASPGADSGHVVRMTVPRATLLTMGVPMNTERRAEAITADVVIGDDGLARAIRFVQ